METYHGHVRTPQDAILLFEACRIGLLPRVQRRLSEKERQQIKSGSVFVWDEREAGMRRWTDGKSWSASRVSGSFLTYREMEGKRGGNFPAEPQPPKRASGKSPGGTPNGDSEGEGPDGYRYKPDGLMKQSFSITTSSSQHLHLISYYARSHPQANVLSQPSQDATLRHVQIPKNMYPESTVNETTAVPAVTRGPMPGSPYTAAGHQMGPASPYVHPGPAPQQVYVPVQHWPPTPNGTPPFQYAYYPPQAHSPVPYPLIYGRPYPAHPQGPTVFDRAPPALSNPNIPHPPHGHPMAGHPAYAHPHAQYMHPTHRMMQANEIAQQMAHAHQHASVHHQVPAPAPAAPRPEQGPQLPAINGAPPTSQPENKAPSPQPTEARPQEALAVPESNVVGNNDNTPARTVPSVGALLNTQPTDVAAETKSNQSNSRSGSKSPNSAQRPTREIPGDRIASNSTNHDTHAIHKLNAVFAVR
ncbi:hypothetical protein P154DRAFT_288755 [Amniculicola lignicola CBS 123094]|uniref:Camp independent regulatory protein n=1 Tax=Amniculicola lignicola CBS 123094 TaxID=1392246 RepID=A0A6A5X1S6_9PLEO|nr:hypothetical protein P154DRAFT_288755 [Amniculicola lignicola CBS 123094]